VKPTRSDQPDLHGFETRLLRELRGVVAQNSPEDLPSPQPLGRRRTRRWVLAGVTAMLAAVALALAPTLLPDAPFSDRAFAVKILENGTYQVSFADGTLNDAQKLVAALRERGISVDVTERPVSPGLVGTVATFDVPTKARGLRWDADSRGFSIDPEQFRGRIRLEVGVTPQAGVDYQGTQGAFYPKEVLAGLQCVLGGRIEAADLARFADRAGVRFEWEIHTPVPDRDNGGWAVDIEPARAVPKGTVVSAEAKNSRVVVVGVLPAGSPLPPAESPAPWDFLGRTVAPPCDQADAARWR